MLYHPLEIANRIGRGKGEMLDFRKYKIRHYIVSTTKLILVIQNKINNLQFKNRFFMKRYTKKIKSKYDNVSALSKFRA